MEKQNFPVAYFQYKNKIFLCKEIIENKIDKQHLGTNSLKFGKSSSIYFDSGEAKNGFIAVSNLSSIHLHQFKILNRKTSNEPKISTNEETSLSIPKNDSNEKEKENDTEKIESMVFSVISSGKENSSFAINLKNEEKNDSLKEKQIDTNENETIKRDSISSSSSRENKTENPTNEKKENEESYSVVEFKKRNVSKFKSIITSHNINSAKSNTNKIEIHIGYETGDVLCFDVLNKENPIHVNMEGFNCKNSVLSINTIPNTNTSIVTFLDGTILFYDFSLSQEMNLSLPSFSSLPYVSHSSNSSTVTFQNQQIFYHNPISENLQTNSNKINLQKAQLAIKKHILFVTESATKTNPTATWKIGNNVINSVSFNQRGDKIAFCSKSGFVYVVNYKEKTISNIFESYYGSFLCASFSEDDKFLACGSEDDLISIFSLQRNEILYRAVGHCSFVRNIQFSSSLATKIANRNTYSLISAGEDGKLFIWEFFEENETIPLSNESEKEEKQTKIPFICKNKEDVPLLFPISKALLHRLPITSLFFSKDVLITCDSNSNAKFWFLQEK